MILPRPARSFGEVVLEVRVAAADARPRARSPRPGAARGRGSCGRSRRSRSARGGARAAARRELGRASRAREVARVDAGADLLACARRAPPARRRRPAGRRCRRASSSTDGRSRSSTSARYASGKALQMGRPATRRGHCFTVGVKRAALVLLARGALAAIGGRRRARASSTAARPSRACSVLGIDVGGKSRGRDRGGRSRSWAKPPVTIRAGGRSYHVPRGWLVSVDVPRDGDARARRGLDGRAASCRTDVEVAAGRRTRAGGAADVLTRDRARGAAAGRRDGDRCTGRTRSSRRRGSGAASTGRRCCDLLADDVDVVDAPFTAERPAILDPAARSAASTAKLLLAAPVAIDYHGARLGALTPVQLSHALRDQAAHASVRGRVRSRARSRTPSARGSASGSSARTTRSSPSPATACSVVPSRPGRDVDPTQVVVGRDQGRARRPRRARRARRARRRAVDRRRRRRSASARSSSRTRRRWASRRRTGSTTSI